MIRRLIDYIRTPDAYHGRPWAYLANQIGHTAIGAAMAAVAPTAGTLALILLYAALIELPQAAFWGGSISDGVEDTAHVTGGALAVCFGWPALILSGLLIAAGIALRIEQSQSTTLFHQRKKNAG